MAHKLGAEFHVAHGRANAILLPHVVEYNGATTPSMFTSFPKYEKFIAPEKFAEVAKALGLPASTPEEGVKSLIKAIKELDMPMNFKACGIDEKEYMTAVDDLAYKAFEDQCTTANPRLPKVSEIAELYKKAYIG